MSDSPFVSVADDGVVRTVTMSNPGRRNAVPADGWAQLAAEFDSFEASCAAQTRLRDQPMRAETPK